MDLLPVRDFIIPCIGHLENTASLSYADLPYADTFLHVVSKSQILVISSPVSSVFRCCEAVKHTVADTGFPEF